MAGTPEREQGRRVMMDMTECVVGYWGGIPADNYLGFRKAAEELMAKKLTSVFTMRKQRREIPHEMLNLRDMDLHQTKFPWNKNCMLLAYEAKAV
ncbi:unnamed protein product [Allacma fusca]|uniref:PiggyBac transposable element-derived protein domain-containing protein n=1 Tax=Allacma fusca TaxID=39272 RepID=A0A8J2P3W7_9HEXA|nr:unnamed protein product [Allacma fusca]